MDSFWVILVLVVVSGISSWLQKRRQAAEEEAPPSESPAPYPRPHRTLPTAPAPSRPTTTTTSRWEEELRRLLEGEPGEVPAPPPPPPPRPAPEAPPRLPTAPRPTVRQPAPTPVVVHRPAPAVPRPVIVPIPQTEETTMAAMETAASQLVHLQQSAQAYGRASQLHEATAERFRLVEQRTVQHRVGTVLGRQRVRPPEIASAVALLRNPRSARQAIVASLILGSPKGLE